MFDVGEETSGIEGFEGISRYIPIFIEDAGLGLSTDTIIEGTGI